MKGSEHYTIPKEPGGTGAWMLAVLTHVLLIAFLWIGVSWQSSEHGGVEAEVWDVKYQEAAPRAQEPEPAQAEKPVQKTEQKAEPEKTVVAKADIALEKEKKRKADEKKREEDKQKKADADKRKQEDADKRKRDQAEEKRLAKLRDEEMRRIAGQTGTGGSGSAARSTGNNRLDPSYAAKVGAKIRANTVFVVPASLDGNPAVEYAIELLPDGTLRTRPRLLKSSGVPGFDEAVFNAIRKSEPFPPDRSGKAPSSFTLIHKPKG